MIIRLARQKRGLSERWRDESVLELKPRTPEEQALLAALLPDHRQKVLDVMEIAPGLTSGKAVEVLRKGWASKLSDP